MSRWCSIRRASILVLVVAAAAAAIEARSAPAALQGATQQSAPAPKEYPSPLKAPAFHAPTIQVPATPAQPHVGQAGKDVVWVPTPQELVDKMLDMAKVTPEDYVIDLGSGDGRTVITAAKRGVRAHGIEYNPEMVALSKANALKAGVGELATFEQADLFQSDFSQATVITMFLLPQINLKLRPQILQLEPGTRIVSNSFDMGDWTADETATLQHGCSSWCTAHLWVVPARVQGSWRLGDDLLELTQEYQVLSGTLRSGGTSRPISDGRLHGAEITFTVDGTRFVGQVVGNHMAGTSSASSSTRWSATRAAM